MKPGEKVTGQVSTKQGFYIGDVCYVLGDAVYHNMWGRLYGFEDGVFEIEGRGTFGVAATASGDGEYGDGKGHLYGVDAGIIGIVPRELIDKDGTDCGYYWKGSGTAHFTAQDGVFDIDLPDGEHIHIDTAEGVDNEEYGGESDGNESICL